MLQVVDADEEFSSGRWCTGVLTVDSGAVQCRYRVREGEPLHAGRPVYWNTKKELVQLSPVRCQAMQCCDR